ncbi:unnamed protein product [Ilex paraguariensis]|uniref:Uncharacterized protein n=1 Tax=Ilex paraguariensis TaxID=185542 RepID=A0ABC8TDN7_9AQUA
MHLVEDAAGKDEDDEETGECKNIFKNIKLFLSHEMSILEKQYHDELKIELQGVQYSSVSNTSKQNSVDDTEAGGESLPDLQQIAEDAASISKVVTSRKKRRLYEAIAGNFLDIIILP